MFNNWITIGDNKSYSEVRGWFHLKEEDMSHWQALVLDNIRAIKNQKMIEYVRHYASISGFGRVYITSGEVGLYEKYGCEYLTTMNDMDGEPSRVYVKRISRSKK